MSDGFYDAQKRTVNQVLPFLVLDDVPPDKVQILAIDQGLVYFFFLALYERYNQFGHHDFELVEFFEFGD